MSETEFADLVVASGLVSNKKLQAAIQAAKRTVPDPSVKDMAKELVRQKLLTKYQLQQIVDGKGDSLTLGNYVVLDKIGQGGMGMVLKANHKRMKRRVALKILSPALTETPDLLQRFQREIEAAAALEHPNVVTAYDADESNGTHFLVMQYVDGVDLASHVKTNGPFSIANALQCIVQAGRGLQYAHEHGIVHRDIKPANLLLDKKGVVQILDMGLARLVSAAPENDQLTATGQIMGTVDYLAPEQAMNTKTADARADIYSLGVTLWYLLTAEPAYTGETVVEKLLAHQQKPIPSLCEARPDASPELEAVFQKMLAKDPEERYQSISEMLIELEACHPALVERVAASSVVVSRPGSNLGSDEMTEGLPANTMQANAPPPAVTTDLGRTVDLSDAHVGTDPQTQKSLVAPQLHGKRSGSRSSFLSVGWIAGIAAGILGLVVLLAMAGIFLKVETKVGTIVLEIDQPELAGATVSIDDQKKITLKTGEGKEPIEITADEATHSLKVTKGGFETFTKKFTVKAGKQQTIRVKLEPLVKKVPPPTSPNSRYALSFDGRSSYVAIPTLRYDGKTPITIEAVATAKQPLKGWVVSDVKSGGLSIAISSRQSWLGGTAGGTKTPVESHVPVVAGEQTHLAFTREGRNCRFFINGRLAYKAEIGQDFAPSKTHFLIGALPSHIDNPNYFFAGFISKVRVSNKVRYVDDFSTTTLDELFVSDESTVALYHFDEGAGDVLKDSSGNAHHGKIEGAKWVNIDAASAITQPASHALSFDGVDDYVNVPDYGYNDTTKPITLEAWVTPLGLPSGKPNAETGFVYGHSNHALRIQPNGQWLYLREAVADKPAYQLASQKRAELGKKTHLAGVYENRELRFYVDGILQQRVRDVDLQAIHAWFEIGAITEDGRKRIRFFHGLIHEIRCSSAARYNGDAFRPEPLLSTDSDTIAHYQFKSGSGKKLIDSSKNQHHGTIRGATWVGGKPTPIQLAKDYALSFDGERSHVKIPEFDHDFRKPITFEATVIPERVTRDTLYETIIGNSGFALVNHRRTGNWSFIRPEGNAANRIESTDKVTLNRRVHLAGCWDGNQLELFVDGKRQALGHRIEQPSVLTPLIAIGAYIDHKLGPANFFKGRIDEVRVSSVARYFNNYEPKERLESDEHTMALYHFDEGKGDVLKDSSGNGHDAKIVGAKWINADGSPIEKQRVD